MPDWEKVKKRCFGGWKTVSWIIGSLAAMCTIAGISIKGCVNDSQENQRFHDELKQLRTESENKE